MDQTQVIVIDEITKIEEQLQPIAVGPTDAARMIGVSRAFIYILINDGKLPCAKLGSRRLIRVNDLQKLIDDHVVKNVQPE
jgi:excisionase family DNA binding protein